MKGYGWVTPLGTGAAIDPGHFVAHAGHVLQSDDNIHKAMTFIPADHPM